MLAPICLFTYNRLIETKKTVEVLKSNFLAGNSHLFIFSDGPRSEKDNHKVNMVREYLHTIDGFKSVSVIESEINKGLAKSIISGVTNVIERFEKAIVVEDDLILSKNFLLFMNQSLEYYENELKVFSISGFSVKLKIPDKYSFDNYFWGRAHSWGWATWKDRWITIDWEINDFDSFKKNKKNQNSFNRYGSDLSNMLKKSMEGRVDSWFIRFTYNQFKQGRLTAYPTISKVINEGFIKEATHTNVYNIIKVDFDKSFNDKFKFNSEVKINKAIGKQVYKYKSLHFRIIAKILTILLKIGIIKQRENKI
jgi:hypothetical protein